MFADVTFWAHAMRPYHWGNNIIVGANGIRPLLITSAYHHKYGRAVDGTLSCQVQDVSLRAKALTTNFFKD